MRRLAALVAALFACGGAASAGGPEPVLAVEWHSQGRQSLLWVNPLTLRAVPGGRLVTGEAGWPLALSPAGRYLLAQSTFANKTMFRLVDLKTKRSSPVLRVNGANGANAVWAGPERMVVVTFAKGLVHERLVLSRNPFRIVSRTSLSGRLVSSQKVGSRLVLLTSSGSGIGPLQLVLVGADAVRTVALEGMQGGSEQRREGRDYLFRQISPALVVDPSGTRAAAIALARYADVDLRTMKATTRVFPERRLQKSIDGWWRTAVWLEGDHVAVTGSDFGGPAPSPAGLLLVNLRDGTVQAVDSTSSEVDLFDRTLIGWGNVVNAYDFDGTLRYRLDGGSEVIVGPSFLYLNDSRDRTSFRVVDPADGRVLGRAQTSRPTWVVSGI